MKDKIAQLYKMIKESNNIVFFGGAGVSTESGIPDFRSKDGLYNQEDVKFDSVTPEYLLSRECLYNSSKMFYEFYRRKLDTRNIKPNVTHKVLAKLEDMGKLKAIVTQNIDGLHQMAGSKNVFEIHGTSQRVVCSKCGKRYNSNYIFESKEDIPTCECRGLIRPSIVLYGESLPKVALDMAYEALESADMLIVAGTSLNVYPAASLVKAFQGKHRVVLNREPIDMKLNDEYDSFIQCSMGDVFSEIEKMLEMESTPDDNGWFHIKDKEPPTNTPIMVINERAASEGCTYMYSMEESMYCANASGNKFYCENDFWKVSYWRPKELLPYPDAVVNKEIKYCKEANVYPERILKHQMSCGIDKDYLGEVVK